MRGPWILAGIIGLLLMCLFAIGCAGESNEDPCRNVQCDQPPADACEDSETLRESNPQGTCDPGTGECEYAYSDRTCEDGCAEGRCVSVDPCEGVVCDQPRDDECLDGATLRVYDAHGTCNPSTGSCEYGGSDRACANGCVNGECVGIDPCEGVVCDQPPPARCVDGSTLEEFAQEGTCDPGTGLCSYERSERECPDDCAGGMCVDPGDGFALVIPAGTRACSGKYITRDVFGLYHSRMRLSFREGVVELPRDEPAFQRDWIEGIEYGPGREPLAPLAEGEFTTTVAAGRITFAFIQEFTDGEETYTLEYSVGFAEDAGPEDRLRVFDEVYLSPPLYRPTNTLDLHISGEAGRHWDFLTCDYDLFVPALHRVETTDGAGLELEERVLHSQDCLVACPTGLKSTTFRLGQEIREVTDPFRLAFVDGYHNGFDRFLIVFEEPVSGIHALHYFPVDPDATEKHVDYLDENLSEIGSSAVTSHQIVELWFSFDARASAAQNCQEYCQDTLFLREGCEAACPLGDQVVAGRCQETRDIIVHDWTALGDCQETFDACVQAGRPWVQCCCLRTVPW